MHQVRVQEPPGPLGTCHSACLSHFGSASPLGFELPQGVYSNPILPTSPEVLGAGPCTGAGSKHPLEASRLWVLLCMFTPLTFLLWGGFEGTVRGCWVQVQLRTLHPLPLTKDPTRGSNSLPPTPHSSLLMSRGGGGGEVDRNRLSISNLQSVHLANAELVPGSRKLSLEF